MVKENRAGFSPALYGRSEQVPAVHHACAGRKREGLAAAADDRPGA